MASKSANLRKAQVSLSCHFCNEQTIQWKCEECDVFMCTSCKEKIHQRLKSIQTHDIFPVSANWKDNPCQIEVASEVITSIFNTYTTTVPVINSLLCSGDDLIYFICHKPAEKARLVKGKMLKSSIRVLQTLEKTIFDIAINMEFEILFKEMIENSDICMLSRSGEIKSVINTSPMIPLSLHVNKDHDIIVGLREPGPPFPVTDFSVRQVIIFDSNFKRKVGLETDKKGGKLFSYPARIKTDSKMTLYVVDRTSKDLCGRIVAVDVNGRLKFTYNGNPDLQTLVPNGIAITSSDNIILSDVTNNALHVLNSKGELLGLQFVDKEYLIGKPYSLCIDSEGYLLIGSGRLENSNANIHVTKIAEQFM